MTEVLKQSDVEKTTTKFLAFPFKTPSTVYVLHFGFLNNGEFFRKFYSANLIKTCYRNPELSSTFSNPISFEVEILLANSQCTEIPWPLICICVFRGQLKQKE